MMHRNRPAPGRTFGPGPSCLAYLEDSEREANTDVGDSMLVAKRCDGGDKTQIWKYANNRITATDNRSITVDAWYQGAAVCLGDCTRLPGQLLMRGGVGPGTVLVFNDKKGTLVTNSARGTLPNDVCLDISPTAGGGDALQLWSKPQPNGAVAVHLINNHQSNTYTGIKITLAEVGITSRTATVRDIWARKDLPIVKDGVFEITVEPRDSAFVLLTPPDITSTSKGDT